MVAAGAAFLAGEWDRARDLIDEARAHGALFEAEWLNLHRFISARETGETATWRPTAEPAAAAQDVDAKAA